MKHPPLLFLDCETLGLDINAPIWEVAAVRVNQFAESSLEMFVAHDPANWVATLPNSFQEDYHQRYTLDNADTPEVVIHNLSLMAKGAIVVGSNPSFDMQRLEKLSSDVDGEMLGWHYHPIDVPTMVHGWLLGKGIAPAPPWKSDYLSRIVGVDPADFDRHTAMGDVRWCKAMWEAITQ